MYITVKSMVSHPLPEMKKKKMQCWIAFTVKERTPSGSSLGPAGIVK